MAGEPLVTPLPAAPQRSQGQANYATIADTWAAAIGPWTTQLNTLAVYLNGRAVDANASAVAAAASAVAAANSATSAASQVALAAAQVGLATTQANNSAQSATNAQIYAAAAQSAVGVPSLVGNKNKFLRVNPAENGVAWSYAGQLIGDILYNTSPPGNEYKLADGSVYTKTAYPEYFAKMGGTPVGPPTNRISPPPLLTGSITRSNMVTDSTGLYWILAGVNSSSGLGNLDIYKRAGDTFTKLPNISLAFGNVTKCTLSGDGVYLAISYAAAPWLEIYKRTSDVFSKITSPSGITALNTSCCKFSDDGVYLYLGFTSSPLFNAFKRSGDVFTKLTTPLPMFNGAIQDISCSGDGTYICLGSLSNSAQPFSLIKRTGDTFSNLAVPVDTGITGSVIAFSKDGNYLAVGSSSSAITFLYKRNGDVFTRIQSLALSTGASSISGLILNNDGSFLFVADSVRISALKNVNDVYSLLTNPTPAFTTYSVMAATFSTDYNNSYLLALVPSSSSQNLLDLFRDNYSFNPVLEFQVPVALSANGTPPASNTLNNTSIIQIKGYIKMKEPT